jgi:AcrR family transcriptional regulator
MRDISRATGVSLSGLYHYCKSKEELLFLIQDHCFGRVVDRLEERIKGVSDPLEKLRLLIDNHLCFFAANMAEMKVLSHEAESLAGDLRLHVATKKEKYAKLARRILREIQNVSAARPSARAAGASTQTRAAVDLTVATYALFGMMNWIYNWYDSSGKLSVSQLVDNITQLFLNGFLSSATARSVVSARRNEKISVWRTT